MEAETYEKFVKFISRLEIHRNPNIKGCPTIDCEGILNKPSDEDILEVQCSACNKVYCISCLHEPHEGKTCEELIENDYEQWKSSNTEIGVCKKCGVRIYKDGGCPHMTCQMCKHEWCWQCKEDFPVHTPQCPNYHLYLEILEFQGLQNVELHPSGWYNYGRRGSVIYWIFSMLFLLILALPTVIIINSLLSPCYSLMMIVSCCHINRTKFRTWWGIILTLFVLILLYCSVPVVLVMVTIPQIVIFAYKKVLELKELCKNKCRYYRKLGVTPIMNKYFDKIGLR
jgi:hypothetical protein